MESKHRQLVMALAGATVGVAACVLLVPRFVAAQADQVEMEAIDSDIEAVRPVTIALAGVPPSETMLTEEEINLQIRRVMREYVRQGLDFSLDGFYPKPVMILYERPQRGEPAKVGIGMTLPPGANVDVTGPLELMQLDFEKAIRHVYIGPPNRLEEVYDLAAKALMERGAEPSWPVVVQILNNPLEVPPEEFKAVLNIPVG
jgi:hypothetical protein